MLECIANWVVCGKQIYVRLDGLGDAVKRQLMQARSVNVMQLVSLLQQLEVPMNPSEPVHVELVVRLQNKVVLVHYVNQSTFSTLFQGKQAHIATIVKHWFILLPYT
jgi:hypothetical protein